MIICNLRLWKHIILDQNLIDEFEDLLKSGILIPVKSFGQYVALLDATRRNSHNPKIAKYFGSDVAKYVNSAPILDRIDTREQMMNTVKEYIAIRTKSKIVPSDKSVVLINSATKKLILTFASAELADYQERLDCPDGCKYISWFDNFLVLCADNEQIKKLDSSLLSSTLLK